MKNLLVSVGMPTYNDATTITSAIETILSQTFTNFELIISDNASSDGTEDICRNFTKLDSRVRYIRQKENIGSDKNLEFVFRESRGEYFMWAPAHYTRSQDFIELNLKNLQTISNCAFSSTPNCFRGEEKSIVNQKSFSLEGSLFNRISQFFENCWVSHACYYSLFPRSFLTDYPDISKTYLGCDWSIILHLLFKGNFLRTKEGLTIMGFGESTDPDFIKKNRKKFIHYLLPFYEFSKQSYKLILSSKELSKPEMIYLVTKIVLLNISLNFQLIKNFFLKYLANLFAHLKKV